VASVTGLAVVIVGYLLARSALGQLGMAVAAFAAYATLLDLLDVDDAAALGARRAGAGRGLGRAGLAAAGRGTPFRARDRGDLRADRRADVALGDGPAENFLGYALTALVAGVCFTAYAGSASGSCWPAGSSGPPWWCRSSSTT
jgi:hypothetical protein